MNDDTFYTENGSPYFISEDGDSREVEAVFLDDGVMLTEQDCQDIVVQIRIAQDEKRKGSR